MQDYKKRFYGFNGSSLYRLKKKAAALLVLLIFLPFCSAEKRTEPFEAEFKNDDSKIQASAKPPVKKNPFLLPAFNSTVKLTVDYPWNASVSFTQYFRFYRDSAGGKRKKLELSAGIELTPATLEADFGAAFLPAGFAEFFAGLKLGSGWNFPKVRFYGMAENANLYGKQKTVPHNFSKLFVSFAGGMGLYFKLADFLKSDWSKLILGTHQALEYKGLYPLPDTVFWFFKNDEGENRNGATYEASYFIEYEMPLYLDRIRMEINMHKKLYPPLLGSKNMAELLWDVELGGTLVFKPADFMYIQIAALWSTAPLYAYSADNAFFTDKVLNYPKMQTFYFKKISAGLLFKI